VSFPYALSEQVLAWIQVVSVLIALVALLFSAIAVYFTVLMYRQKRGAFVRGRYSITSSSIATDSKYVNEVIIENLKDRSLVVFGIYLRLSSGYMIEIESFDDSPVILKPFEVVKRSYDPVDFYSFNARRIDLSPLFDDGYRKNRLVLATTDGKLVVKDPIPVWNPVYDWFRNHLKITAQIHRTSFAGRAYGGNVVYLVDLYKNENRIQSIPIYPAEFTYKWFRDIGGDEGSLTSAESMTALFDAAIKAGKINADRSVVVDVVAIKKDRLDSNFDYLKRDPIVARPSSWFFVNIIGRLATMYSSRQLRRKNRAAQKRLNQEMKEPKKVPDQQD
jgi:hypothetical protein